MIPITRVQALAKLHAEASTHYLHIAGIMEQIRQLSFDDVADQVYGQFVQRATSPKSAKPKAKVTGKTRQAPKPPKTKAQPPRDRIIAAAIEVAAGEGMELSVHQVHDHMVKKGTTLAAQNPKAVIASVLSKAEGFTKVGVGMFAYEPPKADPAIKNLMDRLDQRQSGEEPPDSEE